MLALVLCGRHALASCYVVVVIDAIRACSLHETVLEIVAQELSDPHRRSLSRRKLDI